MSFQLHPTLKADSIVLGRFELCQLLLINDQQYPWFVLVPQRQDIQEIYQLTEQDQELLWLESRELSKTIMACFQGEKLNIAAIGNMVPQLHLHHVVRYRLDPCWPKPVWGQRPMTPYRSEDIQVIQTKMRENLKNSQYVQYL